MLTRKELRFACTTQIMSGQDEKHSMSDFSLDSYDRLSDGEIDKLQLKLARLIVVFFELLHLLITRNRQRLLDVMQERKKAEPAMPNAISLKSQSRTKSAGASAAGVSDLSYTRPKQARTPGPRSTGSNDMSAAYSVQAQTSVAGHHRKNTLDAKSTISLPRAPMVVDEIRSDDGHRRTPGFTRHYSDDHQSVHSLNTLNPSNEKRTGSAIAVQGELQRAFISMAKALYPKVQGIMGSDTPRWFKQCAQDSYFSLGTYKQTKVPIAEEIGFTPESMVPQSHSNDLLGPSGSLYPESPRGSTGGSSHSAVSRGSERYGLGQF